MSNPLYTDPPTKTSLACARLELVEHRLSVQELSHKIQTAENELARIVEESRNAIRELECERAALEKKITLTLAYISPIKRLPHELLRHIFMLNFDEHPCCAWVLSAVCSLWRRMVLSMPVMWSKIRLVTTQTTSADTIRLWLERSGRTVPLDIEIVLRTQAVPSSTLESLPRKRVSHLASQTLAEWGWTPPPTGATHGGAGGANAAAAYVQVPQTPGIHIFPIQGAGGGAGMLLTNAPGMVSATATQAQDDLWGMPPLVSAAAVERANLQQQQQQRSSKKNQHWGHIVFFYLVEQMHRWERFVFRFDKQFSSINALKSIEGDAPLLREFEVSSAEAAFYGDWKWLPSAPANTTFDMPTLTTLTLHNVPFKWSSPMLRNLRSLSIRALPTVHLALDRVMFMIAASPQLESLTLHFNSPTPPVLPLTATTLPELRSLTLSGNYLLSSLIDALILPTLDTLILDIDAREPIEDTVSSLIMRCNSPPITRLSIAYGLSASPHSFYYGGGAGVATWHFLNELDHLRTLQVGSAPFEPLLTTLGGQDDEGQPGHWVCPNLTALAMRACHTHCDGVMKLVQMVEARNPDLNGGSNASSMVGPARLKHLELYDCVTLGPDVLKYLKTRIDDVVCTEPVFEG
ncbi:uncharacterized protein LAESUDRAFT_741435 [Laetiporus sulphureus 93-53]|uniref:Uncharacterized protein n=1 Tax=Laetiporus sulphureus 93-53 TaxID=1314785 RepID=A0A165GH06_9APHY|nr:uncharacterized protein LAESUDRAFT_741435 [Laetiporus sulphureus 93-53]KZT10333.1 hypothetical protein LAESUDRAFT_741435 [Laetiporus sulphureus 93-53]